MRKVGSIDLMQTKSIWHLVVRKSREHPGNTGSKKEGNCKSLTGEMDQGLGKKLQCCWKKCPSVAVSGIRRHTTMLAFVTEPACPRSQLSPAHQVCPKHWHRLPVRQLLSAWGFFPPGIRAWIAKRRTIGICEIGLWDRIAASATLCSKRSTEESHPVQKRKL